MHKERNQRSDYNQRKTLNHRIPYIPRHQSEADTCQNSVATRIAVDTVNQVHCVNYSHAGQHAKWYTKFRRQSVYAPQSVEIVDICIRNKYESQYQEYLYQQSESGRYILYIVPNAYQHHKRHGRETPCKHCVKHQNIEHYASSHDSHIMSEIEINEKIAEIILGVFNSYPKHARRKPKIF